MKYFRVRRSLNEKVMGKIPQIKEVIYPKVTDNPKFIGNIDFAKIEFEPEIAKPILYPKAKPTDLLEDIGAIPFKLLISGKLKSIFKNCRKDGIQFFQGGIFYNGIEYTDYCYLNMYAINNEYIDYKNCSVVHRKKKKGEYGTIPIVLNFDGVDSFNNEKKKARENFEAFFIEKLSLIDVKEDFFILRDIEGGAGYFVSEILKKEIEDTGCTGIEFQPSELSYNEWLAPGGEREMVYGKSW